MQRLFGKTYVFCLKENPKVIVAAFTLSNDSIRITNKLKDEDKETFLHNTELDSKGLRRYPSVLIVLVDSSGLQWVHGSVIYQTRNLADSAH